MGKSLRLFLSLLLLAHCGQGQPTARAGAPCGSQPNQDSLVARFLTNGAHRISYLDPRWALYCDSLIAACPTFAYAYQQKAMPLIKTGKYEETFALLNRAVALDPNHWLAYRGFLKCIFTKDYDGALLDFEQAARLKPNGREMDHTYPFFRGLCQLELGRFARAEAEFNRDLAQQRGADGKGDVHFNTLLYVGIAYLEMKKHDLAATHLQQCLRAYPQHPEANYYAALVARAQGDEAAAQQYLATAQKALLGGYRLNEDNIFYTNYPRQITEFEVMRAAR